MVEAWCLWYAPYSLSLFVIDVLSIQTHQIAEKKAVRLQTRLRMNSNVLKRGIHDSSLLTTHTNLVNSLAPFEHIEQISTRCCICHEGSPQVYENAWSCLNPDCPRFWQDVNSQPLGDDLQYNSQFLQLAPANTLAVPAENLQPASPLLTSYGLTTDYAYTRGWHCKNCGRLSCR